MQYITHNDGDNIGVAKEVLNKISSGDSLAVVVGLYGNLGAGKTTFTKAVAKVLGVEETVTSPTFVVEKVYELLDQKFKHLIHIDAYRLEKESELLSLGWKEITSDPNNLILIEWPERVSGIMPKHIKMEFSHESEENTRKINITF